MCISIYSNLLRQDDPHASAAVDRGRSRLDDRDSVAGDEPHVPDAVSDLVTTKEVVRNG